MTKFRYFGPKSINFVILMKFHMYHNLKVLISNLTLAFVSSQQPSTQATLFNSVFSILQFIQKNSLLLLPASQNCYYFDSADCKYDIKKIQAYSKPQNCKILGNKMNEKGGLEIISKRWEHVTYATVRISMIINQNFSNT